MKLGFVGLGQMGRPIALNLIKSGARMIVSDVKTDAFPEFSRNGASATTNLVEIAGADIIFLCLPDDKVVQEVLLGEAGVSKRLNRRAIAYD